MPVGWGSTAHPGVWKGLAVADYERPELDLSQLIQDLRGLYIEADPHDASIRRDFEAHWSPIDAQDELRTQSLAPAGAASEEDLASALDRFSSWVEGVLSAETTTEHG
jgi:hypothetical protein